MMTDVRMDRHGDKQYVPGDVRLDRHGRLVKVFGQKGGRGSSHHGHAGRPGQVGGSAPGGSFNRAKSEEWAEIADCKQKECWKNSAMVAFAADGTYVEGWVVLPSGIPIEHGWVEKDGQIIDPTLVRFDDAEQNKYFAGNRFTPDELMEAVGTTLPLTNMRDEKIRAVFEAALKYAGLKGQKYSPDQPREPAGGPGGGRWTSGGGRHAAPINATVEGSPVTYYHVRPGQTVSPEDRSKFDRDGAAVLMTPQGELYISSNMLHADIVSELGDTPNYDKYTRVLISGGGIRADSVHLGTYMSLERRGVYWQELSDSTKAKIDNSAARKLWSVTKKLVGAGFSRDKYVQWRMLSGKHRGKIEGTLGEFADGEYKAYDPESDKQYPEPTPTGHALEPWEGQVEITTEMVADALRDWDEKAPRGWDGLLLTEKAEGG